MCDAAVGPDEPSIGERSDDVNSNQSADAVSQSANVIGDDLRTRPSTADVGCETDHAEMVIPTQATSVAAAGRHSKDSSVQTEAIDQPSRDAEGNCDRKHRPLTSDIGCETDHGEMVIPTLATSVAPAKRQLNDSSVQTEITEQPLRDSERSLAADRGRQLPMSVAGRSLGNGHSNAGIVGWCCCPPAERRIRTDGSSSRSEFIGRRVYGGDSCSELQRWEKDTGARGVQDDEQSDQGSATAYRCRIVRRSSAIGSDRNRHGPDHHV
jgi:hypothetical protein